MRFGLPQRLLAAGAICLAALVALVVIEARARSAGTEVILPMQPVDPRSLLSGHYVQMAFGEALPPGENCPPTDLGYEQGWIALRREEGRHVITAAARSRDDAARQGEITMRGALHCNPPVPGADGAEPSPGNLTLQLAVERFHADQDEALAIERAMTDRSSESARVYAILSVDDAGTPRTKGLIVDGRRIMLTW
jgi:uncharacterized membrane-anchored protein